MSWKKKDTKESLEVPKPQELSTVPHKVEEKEAVVNELPSLPQRTIRGEDGNIYHLTTLSEAVQEILENTREILKFAKEE